METKENIIEPLIERVEEYTKISLELIKLKSLDKTCEITSTLISRLLLVVILSLFMLSLTVAAGFWLGDLFGKNYYGFAAVALFYGFIAVLIYFIHPLIKARINNSIIKLILN